MPKLLSLFLFIATLSCVAQSDVELLVNSGLREHENLNYDKAIELYNQAEKLDASIIAIYINRSNSYFEKKDYSKSLIDIEKALKLDPNSAFAYHNRGLTYYKQNRLNEALLDYNRALEIDPYYLSAYGNKIRLLTDMKKPEDIKKMIENVQKEHPNKSIGYVVSHIHYWINNDFSSSLVELNKAVLVDKKDEMALHERAKLKDDIDDEKGAIADYNNLIQLNPNNADYYFERSSCYYDLKEYEKVVDDCSKAILLNDSHCMAYLRRGDAYDSMGAHEKSVADYEKAISLRPTDAEIYNELGKVYFLRNEFSKSLEVFNRILQLKPDAQASLEYRAGCKSKLLDYKGAIEDYDKLIQLSPKNFSLYYNKALQLDLLNEKVEACKTMKKAYIRVEKRLSTEFFVVHNYLMENCRENFSPKTLKVFDLSQEALNLYEERKIDLVIKKYDEMIAIVPDSASLYYDRGKMKRELNRFEEAIVDYKKSLQFDKKNVETLASLANCYTFTYKFDKAIETFLEAIKVDENYAISYHNLALIYSNNKEYDLAIKYLEIATQKDPKYTSAFYQLGLNYLLINENEKACFNFKRAQALGSMEAKIKLISECNN